MRILKLLLSLLALSAGSVIAQPVWTSAVRYGGTYYESTNAVVTDGSDNVYVAGVFSGNSITFGITTLTNANTDGSGDVFVVKFNSSGTVLWAVRMGGTGEEYPSDIAVDASGNVLVTGTFYGSSFTAGSFSVNRSASGSGGDYFLAKLNGSGTAQWVKSDINNIESYGTGVAADASGNVYVAAEAAGGVSFGSITATPSQAGSSRPYLVKYNSSGTEQWLKMTDSFQGYGSSGDVALDPSGNIYWMGTYNGSPTFTVIGVTFNSTGGSWSNDIFVTKLNSSGTQQWARQAGGDDSEYPGQIATDASGNVYITGRTYGTTAAFGSFTLNNSNTNGGTFFAKYNTSGTEQWVKGLNGSGYQQPTAIRADASGNVFASGQFSESSLTVDGNTVTSAGNEDGYLIKFNSSGSTQFFISVGTGAYDDMAGFAINSTGVIIATGIFSGNTIAFGNTTLTNAATTGTYDIYISNLSQVPASTITTSSVNSTYCSGATLNVPFSITGPFTAGNVFTAQLSDASGSFSSTINIGTLSSVSAGSVPATIPSNTPTGAGYRIRVISSTPAVTGTDNGSNISITSSAAPTISITASPSGTVCPGTNVSFSLTTSNGGTSPTYQWTVNSGNVGTGPSYSSSSLNNNDVVSCTITNNSGCASPNNASSSITMSVNGPSVTLSPTSICTGQTLTLTGADNATQILWQNGGNTVSTVTPPSGGNVTTVAGGNGGGGAPNQLGAGSDIFLTSSGDLYVVDPPVGIVKLFPSGSSSSTNSTTVTGGFMMLPTGLFIDANGYMYVVESNNNDVLRFPPGSTSSTIGTVVAGTGVAGSGLNQLNGPLAVYVDAAGNIIVADAGNHRVIKFPSNSTSGTSGTVIAGGNGQGSAANQLSNPYYIDFDSYGNMYVADATNNRVQRFPAGSSSSTNGTTVAGGNGSGTALNQTDLPWGIDIDASDNLYVCESNGARVMRFPYNSTSATNGTVVAGGNGAGTAANQLQNPRAVKVAANGDIYIADVNNYRVQKWTTGGSGPIVTTYDPGTAGTYTAVVTVGGCSVTTNPVTVNAPSSPGISITATPSGTVCWGTSINFSANISNGGSSPLYQWKVNNLNVGTGASYSSNALGNNDVVTCELTSNSPCASPATATASVTMSITGSGIMLAPATSCVNGTLTLTGADNATEILWQQNGNTVSTVIPPTGGNVTTVAGGNGGGGAPNQLGAGSDIFLTSSGDLYVVDPPVGIVKLFPSGSNSSTNSTTVTGGFMMLPTGLFIDANGYMYVVESNNNDVLRFPPGSSSSTIGTVVAGTGVAGSGLNQLNGPLAVYVDASGNIIVTDAGNHRIIKFPSNSTSGTNGTIIAGGNGQGNGADQLNNPYYIDFDSYGNMYVADASNNRVQRFPAGSSSSTNATTVAGGNGTGSALNQTYLPWGIDIDASDNLYVCESNGARVMRFPYNSTSATNGTVVAGGNGVGTAANQLQNPRAVKVAANGDIYIADVNNYRVQKWSTGGGPIVTTFIPSVSGTYTAIATVDGCTFTSNPVTVSSAAVPTIMLNGSNLISSSAGSYQWYYEGGIINGATAQSYLPQQPGNYTVTVTYGNGCSNTSLPYNVLSVGISSYGLQEITLFPNPAKNNLYVLLPDAKEYYNFEIRTITGGKIAGGELGGRQADIDISQLATGTYLLEITTNENLGWVKRFVVE